MGKKNKKGNKKGKKDKNSKKREVPLTAVGRAPTYTKNLDTVEDFLDETEMKSFEKFGCISFASPGETMREQFKVQISAELGLDDELVDKVVEAYIKLEHPKRAVKYLGGRATPDECANRIREVMDEENAFHIYTIENGKWVTFDPSPELIEDENYREEQLNEIMREKKMAEKRTKQFFRSEMRKRVEKARLEGTEAGQQILLEEEEPFQAVQHRVKAADESIAEFEAKIAELKATKDLAERKVEKMIAEGKDKIDISAATDLRIQELAAERKADLQAAAAAEAKRAEIQSQLKEMGDIESARVWPENLGQETAKALQTDEQKQASAAEERAAKLAELEEIKRMADERIAALHLAAAEADKPPQTGASCDSDAEEPCPVCDDLTGGFEPPTELTAPASDAETAAMFSGAQDELLIPSLRRKAEANEAK